MVLNHSMLFGILLPDKSVEEDDVSAIALLVLPWPCWVRAMHLRSEVDILG